MYYYLSDLKYANFLEINMLHMLFEYQKVLSFKLQKLVRVDMR